ncbi:c-type cytochrome [Shewanella sp. AS16]|uniref:c-type cytochrome n=1 Tax=Shewanella sp. AS16 TaxID=2907625 RepID=UPI001F17B0DC|nr:c-type cytochrome [Shewanella sp. AS16]MCE9687330.1 c-type cytochrome [Shewanella sp. AS16]
MAIAIVILLLVAGSLIFHFASPWWFTPLASNWGTIDDTIKITFWVTGIVFVAVNVFLAYAVYRYRFHKDQRADYEPENKRLEGWLVLGTTLGVAAMLAPGLFVWAKFVTVPEDAQLFEAVGQQWFWSFRLPGKDGVLGQTSTELIDEKNPFGINPKDSAGMDDILVSSNEMHIPAYHPVKVVLRSKDVLHDFSVPQFRVKMDLVPGIVSYLWFTPTRIGRFELMCQELCGMAHYSMRGHIVVDSQEDYRAWLAQQVTFAQSMQAPAGDLALGKQVYQVCGACHGSEGEGNDNLSAPKLAGQHAWYLKRQLGYFKNKVRGATEKDPYGQQMAAIAATLTEANIQDVSAYIASLPAPANGASPSMANDRGKQLYHNCAYCHGDQGEGKFALNAPALSGQQPAYLKRQLKHFQQQIRGAHQQDTYGNQMLLMSRLLQDEQAVEAVAAYLNTLPAP